MRQRSGPARAPAEQVVKDIRPGDLEAEIEAFVVDYNHLRYHESIGNLMPADVYFGRGQRILDIRKEIKRRTIDQRRRQHFKAVA